MDFQEGSTGMKYDLFSFTGSRRVLLCGTNYYPTSEFHVDRVLEEHDLMYILEGSWQVAQDGTLYDLYPGDILLLHAGRHHWGTAPCSVNARNMFIHFNPLPSDRVARSLTAAEAQSYVTGRSVLIPPLTRCGLETRPVRIFSEIIHVFWSHQEDRQRRMNILLSLLLNEIADMSRHHQEQSEEWIVQLLQAFRGETGRFFSLEETAEIAGMTVRTLSARFQKVMGKSVHQYQVDEKLESAYGMLRTGRYTVKEVSLTLGFSDPYYFSRVFKARFGVSPSEIKQREPSANINRPPVV